MYNPLLSSHPSSAPLSADAPHSLTVTNPSCLSGGKAWPPLSPSRYPAPRPRSSSSAPPAPRRGPRRRPAVGSSPGLPRPGSPHPRRSRRCPSSPTPRWLWWLRSPRCRSGPPRRRSSATSSPSCSSSRISSTPTGGPFLRGRDELVGGKN